MTGRDEQEHLRYAKQVAVPEYGAEAQRLLASATVAIVGCGALGAMQAELLARMGVGTLRIADADIVSLGNLHRQMLFTERDAEEGVPKVAAAAARLTALNSRLSLHTVAERITRVNITSFVEKADLILDATDNAATRFLINDFCVRNMLPWIYTGVAGTGGMIFPILPQEGPCLRCLYPDPPAEEDTATCAISGILPTTVTLAVSLQVTQALRILNRTAKPGAFIRLNVWEASVRTSTVHRDPACPCCGARRFDFLDASAASETPLAVSVCSQRLVRIEAAFWVGHPFDAADALRLAEVRGATSERKGLLWLVTHAGRRISLFPDGHLLVHDCTAPNEALAAARALFQTES
jgi:adenylyltransferase/sulfurtransferase